MKIYELSIIMVSDNTDDELKKEVDVLKKRMDDIGKDKFKIINAVHWGRKKFAYPIKRQEYGYYIIFTIKADPTVLPAIKQELKHYDRVIRFMVLAVTETKQKKPSDEKKEPSGQEKAPAAKETPVKES